MRQSSLEQERILRMWERRRLSPPDDEDDEDNEYCECGEEAKYEVIGERLCQECANRKYLNYDRVCEFCGKTDSIVYIIYNDVYCHKCFESHFRRF